MGNSLHGVGFCRGNTDRVGVNKVRKTRNLKKRTASLAKRASKLLDRAQKGRYTQNQCSRLKVACRWLFLYKAAGKIVVTPMIGVSVTLWHGL